MCLAVPARVLKIDAQKEHAIVDYGDDIRRTANISLVDANVGDYVLIHAGFAIQIISKEEAQITIDAFKEIISASAE